MTKTCIKSFLCGLAFYSVLLGGSPSNTFTRRFVQMDVDMLARGYNQRLFSVLDRAASIGYNGVWFRGWYEDMDTNPKKKKGVTELKQLIAHAKSKGLAAIPMSLYVGEVAGEDSSFSEALPVKGTRLVVENRKAVVFPDHDIALKNGGFENANGVVPADWGSIGSVPFIDNQVKRGGNSSVRFDNPMGYSCVKQTIGNLKPFRAYELSVWIRTVNFKNAAGIKFAVIVGGHALLQRRDHSFCPWDLNQNQAWRRYTIDFNTLNYSRIEVRMLAGMRGSTGSVWFDDVAMREVALYETIRRPSCPVVVRSKDGKTVYQDGRDYHVIRTPYMCCNCGENQGLEIPDGSRIQNGQTLLVDWFQNGNVETAVAPTSFCSREAWEMTQDNIQVTNEVFGSPPGWNAFIDEWRVANWDPACTAFFPKAGQYMGYAARMHTDLLKAENANREIYICNDMYDPYHNALPVYGATNGGCDQSWNDLPDSTVIINWLQPTYGGRSNSVRFFAGLDPKYPGVFHRQIVTSFYGPGTARIWEDTISKVEEEGARGIVGFGFVNWSGDFTDLEACAQVFINSGRWGSGPIPFPKAVAGVEPRLWPPEGVGISDRKEPAASIKANGFHLNHTSGRILFTLGQDAHVRFRLVDVSGRTVLRVDAGKRVAGKTHLFRMPDLALASGIYFLEMQTKSRGATQRAFRKTMMGIS